jgi:hypothetical protein
VAPQVQCRTAREWSEPVESRDVLTTAFALTERLPYMRAVTKGCKQDIALGFGICRCID